MKNLLRSITGLIVILSGLNIGLDALLNFNVIHTIFGSMPALLKVVHIIIGLSALVFGGLEFTEKKMF